MGNDDTFAERLRLAMRKRTVREVSDAADISESTIHNWLYGNRTSPRGEQLAAVARALGVSADYLCARRRHYPPEDRHEPVSITTRKADAMIWAWTRHLFSADVIARAARKLAKKRQTTDAGKTEKLERDRAVLTERIRRNAERASAGLIPDDVLADIQGPLIAERERIDRELARQRDVTTVDFAGLSGLATEAQATLDAIEQSDARVQVQFLQRIYERIDLHSDHLLFHHRLPIPDKRIDAPAYYSPGRGLTDIPF